MRTAMAMRLEEEFPRGEPEKNINDM